MTRPVDASVGGFDPCRPPRGIAPVSKVLLVVHGPGTAARAVDGADVTRSVRAQPNQNRVKTESRIFA